MDFALTYAAAGLLTAGFIAAKTRSFGWDVLAFAALWPIFWSGYGVVLWLETHPVTFGWQERQRLRRAAATAIRRARHA